MKMNAKKVMSLIMAGLLAAASLTACGGSGSGAKETTAAQAADSGEKKVLRVAMECAYGLGFPDSGRAVRAG